MLSKNVGQAYRRPPHHKKRAKCLLHSSMRLPTPLLLLLFTLLTLLTLVSGAPARDPSVLVVGMELAYPPFEMAGKNGQPEGISPDLARALGVYLNRKTEILNLPFDGLIPSLKTGKIDLILSSMTATEERARSVDFSEPYLSTGLCMLVNGTSDLISAQELDKPARTVAVKQGTTGHLYARKLKNAKVLVLDRETACVLEVAQGRADAFLYDQMSVLNHAAQNPNTTRALLTPIQTEHWAVGIQKGNEPLRQQVNAFLKDFKEHKGFEALGSRWLGPQRETFQAAGIPFVF